MKNLQTHHSEADSLNTFVEETMPILWFIAPGFTPGMMRNPERGMSVCQLAAFTRRIPTASPCKSSLGPTNGFTVARKDRSVISG